MLRPKHRGERGQITVHFHFMHDIINDRLSATERVAILCKVQNLGLTSSVCLGSSTTATSFSRQSSQAALMIENSMNISRPIVLFPHARLIPEAVQRMVPAAALNAILVASVRAHMLRLLERFGRSYSS